MRLRSAECLSKTVSLGGAYQMRRHLAPRSVSGARRNPCVPATGDELERVTAGHQRAIPGRRLVAARHRHPRKDSWGRRLDRALSRHGVTGLPCAGGTAVVAAAAEAGRGAVGRRLMLSPRMTRRLAAAGTLPARSRGRHAPAAGRGRQGGGRSPLPGVRSPSLRTTSLRRSSIEPYGLNWRRWPPSTLTSWASTSPWPAGF